MAEVMTESYVRDGAQDPDRAPADRAVSRTDPCLGWERTVRV